MKNSANALAPSGVCCVAATGITGGFSPGFVLGPVRGTSDGTVGGAGADEDELLEGGGAIETDVVGVVSGGLVGSDPPELVQPASSSVRNAAYARMRRTAKSCRTGEAQTRSNTCPVDSQPCAR
jgi:hypothetical protein